MSKVDLRVIVLNVPKQDVITRDNVSVKVNAVVYFRIVDPGRAIIQVANAWDATSQVAQTTLRSVLGQHEMDDLLSQRDKLNGDIQRILDQSTEAWGIKVANVEIKDVDLDESMIRAMAKQAEAERTRRAKVIHAEGEKQAAQTLVRRRRRSLASTERAAVALPADSRRYLAREVAVIIFPLPLDLIRPLLGALDRPDRAARLVGASPAACASATASSSTSIRASSSRDRIFLRTILAADVRPADIVAQVTAPQRRGRQAPRRGIWRARARSAARAGWRLLQQDQSALYADRREFDVLVACDTDLAIMEPLDEAATTESVRARRVDQENPPLAVLERIREFLGFAQQPPLVAPGCCPSARHMRLNCNGGVLLIPRQFMRPLGEAWLDYARTLTDHRHLFEQWVNHIDQVSWTFAMLKLALPFQELPVEYNFPTRLAKRMPQGSFGKPVVLHYHRALDRKGRLRLSRVRSVDKCIKEVNRLLEERQTFR